MKTREFIKAGMVNNGTKVMVNKGAKYECGRQTDHRIVGYLQEPFEATCVSDGKSYKFTDKVLDALKVAV